MNILEVQDLCKTYGKGEAAVQALRHATFTVRKGEFIAIIGESGSGKSTLLNVVGALDKATSGKVWIDGQDIFSMPEKKLTVFRRQHIGFIFQSFNLIPELNVEQNITFPLLLDYKRPDQRFVNELLNVLGLTERRHHLPSQLSGGQQQRVAIGRASTPGENDDVGCINSYSYLKHEFKQAEKKNKTIIVVYNSLRRESDWLPSYMKNYEDSARPFWTTNYRGDKVGDYSYIKEVLGF